MSSVSVEHSVEVEVDVECADCGADLDADVVSGRGGPTIRAQACPACIESAVQEARESYDAAE